MQEIEETLVFLKPMYEGFDVEVYNEGEVLAMLINRAHHASVLFTEKKPILVTLTKDLLRVVYPKLNDRLLGATISHLCDKDVNVFIFRGDNSIIKIGEIVGTNANPAKCDPSSIRFQLWEKTKLSHNNPRIAEHGLEIGEGLFYYFNFIHCTRSEEEVKAQLSVFNQSVNPKLTWQ